MGKFQYEVLDVEHNYRGLSYGSWAATQRNWLFSERPDYQYENDILFLRGSMFYSGSEAAKEQKQTPSIPDKQVFHNRTGDLEERIHEEAAIFVPVITATFVIGESFGGTYFENEDQIRNAARKETRLSGDMWAVIKNEKDADWKNIVTNIKDYWIESPLFRLRVSDKNPFLKTLELPLEPGEYDAVVVGYFILIKHIDPGRYRIQFGAKGRGDYRTDAIYDIYVESKLTNTSRDVSKLPYKKEGRVLGRIPDHGTFEFSDSP